jgi:uncharacterized membrane protein
MNKGMSTKPTLTIPPRANMAISVPISLPAVMLVSAIAIFAALRLWHMTTYSIWGGEAFSIIGAKQHWNDMFSYIIADIVHPPLFYVLLKLWILVGGESLLWLKLFSVLNGIAIIVPFLLLCRELDLRLPVVNLSVLLIAVNGYLIHYAQELRMYSMFTFLTLCSFWLFIRFFKSTDSNIRLLLILTVVNLLTIYTHYYGWLAVGLEFLFLLMWRRKAFAFGVSILILLLIFSPWAFLVIQEAKAIGGLEQNLDWIPKPHLVDILDFYATLNGSLGSRYIELFGFLLFSLPLLPWFISMVRTGGLKSTNEDAILFSWLALLSFLPVIVIFLVSQNLEQAVWIDRYFIFIAAPYMLLVAAAVYRLESKWLRQIYIFVIVLWSVLACITDLRTNRMAWTGAQLGSRIDWEALSLQMEQAESAPDYPVKVYSLPVVSKGVSTGYWTIATSLDYYLDLHHDARFEMMSAHNNHELINMLEDDHFWVAYFDIIDWPQPPPDVALDKNGYRIGNQIIYDLQGNRIVLLSVWKK